MSALAEESSLDWRAYPSRVQMLSRSRGASDAEEARLLREGQRLQIWRKVGERNMVTYVERYFGYGQRAAYDRLRVANVLAVESGEIFYAAVRADVAIWETEKAWLEKAMGKSVCEVQSMSTAMVSGRKKGGGPEAPSKPTSSTMEYPMVPSKNAWMGVRMSSATSSVAGVTRMEVWVIRHPDGFRNVASAAWISANVMRAL